MPPVQRYDQTPVGRWEDNGRGGLVIPAHLTRIGVFMYSDGVRTWGELRRPEQVFARDSLASMRNLPVTDLHPAEFVTSQNWRDLNRGHIDSKVEVNGDRVFSHVHVEDGDLVVKVKSGDRQDISLGYTTDLVESRGEYGGIAYEYEQTNIRYNHAAIGPRFWGRAGPTVGLRTDSLTGYPIMQHSFQILENGRVVVINGQRFDCREDGGIDGARRAVEQLRISRQVPKTDNIEDLQRFADQLMAALASMEATVMEMAEYIVELQAAGTEPGEGEQMDVETMDRMVAKRMQLLQRAQAIRPDGKYDSKSDREIQVEALVGRHDAADLASRSDDYVQALFDCAPVQTSERSDHGRVRNGLLPPTQRRAAGNKHADRQAKARKAAREKALSNQ